MVCPEVHVRIWVDADACPRAVKDILYRASARTGVEVVLVANQALHIPTQTGVRLVTVGQGFDVADEHISAQVQPGELVVTQDIPLAADVVERGATCIDPRGEVIDAENARARLRVRDLMETLRESGEMTGGPKAWSQRDAHRFAAALDRWLSKRPRTAP